MTEPGITLKSSSTSSLPSKHSTTGSWLGGKKRDWDNAFQEKYNDLEATLQENDRWLALYWESVEAMKGTKADIAITKALKTSSARRRGRARMDVRDVFDAASKVGQDSEYSPLGISHVSQLSSPFNTASLRKYRSMRNSSPSSASLQGNTLTWALSQMPMIPSLSPDLINGISQPNGTQNASDETQDTAVDQEEQSSQSSAVGIIRSPVAMESKKPPNYPQASLTRSNSAAAKAAAAVKHLQAISVTPPTQPQEEQEQQENPRSASVTPNSGSPRTSPQMGSKFTAATAVPTLRDMLLNRHPPIPPTGPLSSAKSAKSRRSSRPYVSINTALGSLSLDTHGQRTSIAAAIESSQSSAPSSPDIAHPRVQTRSLSISSSEAEQLELTKSEEDVRERLQRVKIALGSSIGSMKTISEHSETASEVEEARRTSGAISRAESELSRSLDHEHGGNIADALSPDSTEADLTALRRDIAAVESMLSPSLDTSYSDDGLDTIQAGEESANEGEEHNGDVDDHSHDEDEQQESEHSNSGVQNEAESSDQIHDSARKDSVFVNVFIDQQPMDVRLDDVKVDEASKPAMKHVPGLPGKRKHSNEDLNARAAAEASAQNRLLAPTASSLARGRGRGRGRGRTTGIPRNPVLRGKTSAASIASQRSAASSTSSNTNQKPASSVVAATPAHGNQGIPRPGSRLERSGASASSAGSRIAMPTGAGHVAATRKKFEPLFGPKNGSGAMPFASPVAAMRPGYASMLSPAASITPSHDTATSRRQLPQPATTTAGKPRIANPTAASSKLAKKSSAAAMREAVRRAEAATKLAKKRSSAESAARPALNRTGNEPLFRSVSRPASALSNKSSQNSLKSKASKEQIHLSRNPSGLIPEIEILKTPLKQKSSTDVKTRARKSGGFDRAAIPSAIPVPLAQGKVVAANLDSSAESSKPGSVESGWGISSVLSMLSPSSWKSQSQTQLHQQEPSATNAKRQAVPETPAGQSGPGKATSPYNMNSPQTPYQPRPEHGGATSKLMMPKYQDVSVPLRRSTYSKRSGSSSASPSPKKDTSSLSPAQHKEISSGYRQRLISQATDGRISGVSSFRSSFFSDDEYASPNASSAAHGAKRSPGLGRARSTPDMAQDLSSSSLQDPSLVTPAQGLRHKRVSSLQSKEYTSIIPDGSNSPPEIESDYSDEYSDEEFSPAPKRKKNDFKIPAWATTPELAKGLQRQERVNPDRIFGRVKPLRISEIFNRKESSESRRKPRNSSMIWTGGDALTSEDELEYIRRMGFDQ
ncbi:hypothetical protein GGI12_001238 [Dipsacomyces acuminosporus]|nr:hypothetical protein GGI12_001238 [Dipsacomyces acuminosporus]